MSHASETSGATVIGLLATVGAGCFVGTLFPVTPCSNAAGVMCLAGMVLALIALFRWPWNASGRSVERIAAAGLLAYVVLATVTEQFASVYDATGVMVAVAWLSPLVAAGLVLPRRGCWFAGLGCWAVLFAATAALAYSATHVGSGMGLFWIWRE